MAAKIVVSLQNIDHLCTGREDVFDGASRVIKDLADAIQELQCEVENLVDALNTANEEIDYLQKQINSTA